MHSDRVRTEVRHRLGALVALAVLVALVGGTVLAGVSAARRTSSAFPQFVSRYGFDAGIFSTTPSIPSSIAHMSDVGSVSISTFYANGNVVVNGQFLPGSDLAVISLPSPRPADTVKLIGGRMPVGPFDALAGFSMQKQFGLHIGSTVTVPLYAPSQRQIVFASNGTPTPHGPMIKFRIVGFESSMLDFPSNSPSFSLYTSAAFDHTVGRKVVVGSFAMVHLVHGAADLPRFTYAVNHLTLSGNNFLYVESEDAQIDAVEGSIRPQATGWWLFALLAGLTGNCIDWPGVVASEHRRARDVSDALGTWSSSEPALRSRYGPRAAIGVAGMAGTLAFAIRGLAANAGGRGPRRRADRGFPL